MSSNRFGRPLPVLVNQRKLSNTVVSPKSWLLLSFASLIIFILCPTGHAVDDINAIMDKQEADVRTLAGLVLQNYRNSSALAEGCQIECSRRKCQALTTDNFVCASAPSNDDCRQPDNSSCTSTVLDWNQSFVTGSKDANLDNEPPNCDMRKTICAQKQLDRQFFTKEDMSKDPLAGFTYFGASNGLLRTYPGKEWNQTACSTYELRGRPWFVAATALAKDIVVMLDAGPSAGTALAVNFPSDTVFAALKNITTRMLKTLTYQDRISVFTLAKVATIVGKTSVPTGGSISVNASVFETLNAQIQDLGDPGQQFSMGQANLTDGLSVALTEFNEMSNLKIVIFLTTGDFTGEYLDESLVEDLKASKVTIFIFRVLSTMSSGGNDTETKLLQNVTCIMKGGYAEQVYDRRDPFATLQPFYNYVARLRFDQNGQRPFWVTKYATYSAQGQVISVAMPIFDGGVLLGVATRNIILDYLQNETSNVNQVLSRRNTVSTLQLNNNTITNLCGHVALPDQKCPAILSMGSQVTGFCTNVNYSSTFVERLCCKDSCPWPFPKSGGYDKTNEVLIIALTVPLSSGFVLLSAICVGCWWKRRQKEPLIIRSYREQARSQDMFDQGL